ncbi:FGGY-family carbohydrate kinase [Salinisphaera aquimarina]|uniref:FGGY-family carbohydrate kinase n=1 Tax=Salinisphaera aquimarina TaxID=2094031 RepID=A0ABV7EWH5_9GAMM
MAEADRILAIDVGTQSVRALVFDRAGTLSARAQIAIDPPYVSPEPGFAEQDPDLFWQAITRASQTLWRDHPGLERRIAGLALTTQRATTVFLDARDEPIMPAVSWLDQRRADRVPRLPLALRLLAPLVGAAPVIAQLQRAAPANWLAAHAPNQHAHIAHAVLLSGYLTQRLTGRWADSVSAQVGYIPFDYKHRRWARAGDWKWNALSLAPAQMPQLVEPGAPIGPLTEPAAASLGLPAGLTLFAAGADKACEVLGAGATGPETACVSLGTTATINTCRQQYREITRFVPAYPAAMPDAFTDEIQIYRGFWLVSWFKREFAADTRRAAADQNRPAEALLDEAIAPIAAGSDGLMVMPTWAPGVREPGPEARGAIVGFTEVHTRAHVYRAILEGLAFGLREGRERIEKRSGTPITRLRVAGGGSQSDQAMQILADMFDLPAERSHTFEASGLGAAINAAVGLGWHADHRAAAAAMVHAGARFEPRPAVVACYAVLYRDVYTRLYADLKPTLRRLARVLATGQTSGPDR